MPSFNELYLHWYVIGRITKNQILAIYPWETAATLAAAVAIRAKSITIG